MLYNDSNEVPEGPVVVRRPVYDAGMKLEAEVQAGASGPAFENAREKVHACHAAGDAAGEKGCECASPERAGGDERWRRRALRPAALPLVGT
jgi:hypothetical protein